MQIAVLLAGPLVWLVALVAVSISYELRIVGIALIVLAGSAVVALLSLLAMRRQALRENRES